MQQTYFHLIMSLHLLSSTNIQKLIWSLNTSEVLKQCWNRGNSFTSNKRATVDLSQQVKQWMQDERSANYTFSLQWFTKFLRLERLLKDATYITCHNKWARELSWHPLWLQCFQFQRLKWGSLINLFTLYKSYIEHNVELLVILFHP